VAVVADSAPAEIRIAVGSRVPRPFGRLFVGRALDRLAARAGGDPRATQPIAVVGLLEDMPLLLVHGSRDRTVSRKQARRLLAAAPPGTRSLEVEGAGHGEGHRTDPASYEAAVTELLREAFRGARS
jgi:fermentation-respiration switch protein FrsA (DUF1100 family)